MFSGIMIILMSIIFMGIIITFAINYFDTLENQQKYNNNKVILSTINDILINFQETDIGSYKQLDISNDDEIIFDANTKTITIIQEVTNSQIYENTKDNLIYGNLTITKKQNTFEYVLDLNGIIDLNNNLVILPGMHTIDFNFINEINNTPQIVIDYKKNSFTTNIDILFTPTASPIGGVYGSLQEVSLSAEEGAEIYYTIDGTIPTSASNHYTTPITIPEDTTITLNYISIKDGISSPYSSQTYATTHQISTPTASPVANTYTSAQNVTLSSEVGATIYYTTDGNTPNINSFLYSTPIYIPSGTTTVLKAIAVKEGNDNSNISSGTYTITDWNVDNLSFNKRKKITISRTNIDSNLTDFPLLVKISEDANIGSVAMEDGNDLRFTTADGNLLYSEKEDFNISGGAATGNFWVKVPSISSVEDTNIYVYYGSAGASAQVGSTNVWDSNYVMVQHENEISGTLYDSTANGNNGTPNFFPTTNQNTIGKIGGTNFFDGNDFIDLPDYLGYTTQVSAFAWFKKFGSPPGNYHIIFGGYQLETSITPSGEIRVGVNTNVRNVSNHGSGLLDGNWHYIGFTFNGTTKNAYIDGNYVGQQINISGTLSSSFSRRIGRFGTDVTYYLNGFTDEIRISKSTRSDAWIKFEYNNINSANNELTFGSQETP